MTDTDTPADRMLVVISVNPEWDGETTAAKVRDLRAALGGDAVWKIRGGGWYTVDADEFRQVDRDVMEGFVLRHGNLDGQRYEVGLSRVEATLTPAPLPPDGEPAPDNRGVDSPLTERGAPAPVLEPDNAGADKVLAEPAKKAPARKAAAKSTPAKKAVARKAAAAKKG